MLNRISIAILFALICFLPEKVSGAVVGKPGDLGTIEIPIELGTGSVVPMEGVDVSITIQDEQFRNHFTVQSKRVKETGDTLPATIQVAQTRTLVVEYRLGSDIPEGSFNVDILTVIATPNVLPDPAANDTSVKLDIDPTHFIVGGRQLTFWERAGKTRQNLGLPEFYHRA